MPLVPEAERTETLRKWGISQPLIRLSSGELLHEVFRFVCLGPPWAVYRGDRGPPLDEPMAPFWEDASAVEGARHGDPGLEFVRISREATGPEDVEVLATTEQGFWVHKFNLLYEGDEAIEDLREAAAGVGFVAFERFLRSRQESEETLGDQDAFERWLRDLVDAIDRGA